MQSTTIVPCLYCLCFLRFFLLLFDKGIFSRLLLNTLPMLVGLCNVRARDIEVALFGDGILYEWIDSLVGIDLVSSSLSLSASSNWNESPGT